MPISTALVLVIFLSLTYSKQMIDAPVLLAFSILMAGGIVAQAIENRNKRP